MTVQRDDGLFAAAAGRVIAALRERAGVPQGALGVRANLPQSTVSRIENGMTVPSVYDLWRISIALSVTCEALCGALVAAHCDLAKQALRWKGPRTEAAVTALATLAAERALHAAQLDPR